MLATMTVGVSGSGKSTYADLQDPHIDVVERDAIRFGFVAKDSTGWRGKNPYKMTKQNEALVNAHQDSSIRFNADLGLDIILSDTWLDKCNRRSMYQKLKSLGYEIKVVVIEVPLKVAIERDSYRGNRSVGEEVIRRQWDKFQGAKAQLLGEVEKFGISVVHFNNYGNYEGKELL